MGELKKLKIVAYKDNAFSQATGKTFTLMVNPTRYAQKQSIRYSSEEALDGGNNPAYKGYGDGKLNFEFMLDSTGVIAGTAGMDLPALLKDLEDTVYSYVGDVHEPPYVKIEWGTLNYQGRAGNLEVDYTFFSPEGEPLRANVKLELLQYIDKQTQEQLKKKSSPDLSHLITVKAGDTLPILCREVYGSTVYCAEVARVNGLAGLRNIPPGTELFFPPLSTN